MKKFIAKYFKIEHADSPSIDVSEQIRKIIMLYSLMVLGIILLVTMGTILYREGNYFYSILDFILAIIIVGLIFLLHSGIGLKICSILSVLLIQFFFMFLFHSGVSSQMAFVWYYLFPLVALFLLGTGLGTFFSLLMIGLSIALNFSAGELNFIVPYPSKFMSRIVLSYMGVLFFTFVFEKTRMSTYNKLKITMNKMNELAIRDGLTGLYNRRYMDVVVKKIIQQVNRSGSAVGFLMADLDYFKKYNDSYGHQAGDKLLRELSEMFRSMLQRKSDYVFRYGGEEFAFLLPSTDLETAEKFAAKIIENTLALNIPHSSNQLGLVTVSVGVSFIDSNHNKNFEELVEIADKALYEAKNSGRNRFVVNNLQ
jgi:diguanylate cyclase (GGDEF)-like protein